MFIALLITLGAGCHLAWAADIVRPDRENRGEIAISAGNPKNLYTAGGNVLIETNVAGDLTVAGGSVNVSGNVEQDLAAAGGSLNINGKVGGDVRIAGGSINLQGPINGDLIIMGGNIHVSSKASIGGDVIAAGGNITLDSPIAGSVRVMGGTVTVNNVVNGAIYAKSKELTFGSASAVKGEVYYTGSKAAVIKKGAKIGEIQFKKVIPKTFAKNFVGLALLLALLKFINVFVASLLAVKFLPVRVKQTLEAMRSSPGKSLGIGFVGAVVIPVVIILLFISFIGQFVGALVLLGFFLALLFSAIGAALFAGQLIASWTTKKTELTWPIILLGSLVVVILRFVPIIGWLALCVLMLLAFGAILRRIKSNGADDTK